VTFLVDFKLWLTTEAIPLSVRWRRSALDAVTLLQFFLILLSLDLVLVAPGSWHDSRLADRTSSAGIALAAASPQGLTTSSLNILRLAVSFLIALSAKEVAWHSNGRQCTRRILRQLLIRGGIGIIRLAE
jgi:hypothetical protein